MSDFDLEIKIGFLTEALENMNDVDGYFKKHETTQDSKPLLDKMFFVAHNLKGGSLSVGFTEVAELTHQLENLVLKMKKEEIPLTSEIIETLLRSNKRVVEMLTTLLNNQTATFDNKDFLKDIQVCYSKVTKPV